MKTAIPYWQKLKDPRWQRRRLEVMERDEFTCVACGDKGSTLNVHHVIYLKNHEPWDYPDHLLKTLCEQCHAGWAKSNEQLLTCLANFDFKKHLHPYTLLTEQICRVLLMHPLLVMVALDELSSDPSWARVLSDNAYARHRPEIWSSYNQAVAEMERL